MLPSTRMKDISIYTQATPTGNLKDHRILLIGDETYLVPKEQEVSFMLKHGSNSANRQFQRPEFARAARLAGKFRAKLGNLEVGNRGFNGRITAVFLKALRKGQGPPGLQTPNLDALIEGLHDMAFGSQVLPLNKPKPGQENIFLDAGAPEGSHQRKNIDIQLEIPIPQKGYHLEANGKTVPNKLETLYLTLKGTEYLDADGKRIGGSYQVHEVFASDEINPDLGVRVSDLEPLTLSNASG